MYSKLPFFLLICFTLLISFISCSQNEDQREFERAAFSEASGFTRTNTNGEVIQEDPDDWRIAPFFQGLIEISSYPAPNPVQTNDRIVMNLLATGIEPVSGIIIYVYYRPNSIKVIPVDDRSPLPAGLLTIQLNPLEIAEFVEQPAGLYRVILLDRNENVITYGDIKVE